MLRVVCGVVGVYGVWGVCVCVCVCVVCGVLWRCEGSSAGWVVFGSIYVLGFGVA